MNAGANPNLLKPGGTFGDYTVVKLLGAGGMGAVYLIRGDASGREFAVKILDPEMEKSDPEFKQRFIFEAELAMSIRHENLIEVFDVGRDPETGYAYILMEYVPGGTVRDRLTKWGALSVEEAGDIVSRVARALAAVAAHHVVHRDVKPDNIMFTADGVTPKLADLGIARLANEKTRHTAITENGFIIGSPAYMSPEQMENAHLADIRSDIHALGVTFWEMLAGRRPYEGEDALAIVARAMKGEAIPDVRRFRPDVPAGIADLIARMTRPNVEERIQTPDEVADELDRLLATDGGSGRRRIRVPSRRELAALRQAARSRRRNALGLAPVNVFALHLCHIAQQLQNNIGNQRTRHVRPTTVSGARVEQRHVQHHDGGAELFGYAPPFLEDLAVVTAQPINGKYHQHITGIQRAQQLAIPRSIEVLAARTIGKDIRWFHAIGAQRIQLPIQILITRAHPRIPVHRCHLIPALS